MPRDWIEVVAFRVAEEPGRIPVDVRCACGQEMSFRRVFVPNAVGCGWAAGEVSGLCPSCRRPIRVEVRVQVKAHFLGPSAPAEAETGRVAAEEEGETG